MTNAHAPARFLTFLVVASAAATAHAQTPAFEWETSVTWPDALGDPGAIGRVVAGDVDGDLRPDVFARGAASPGTPDGSFEILFLDAPWLGNGTLKLGVRSIDFDMEAGSPGDPDVLAFTKVSGLWRLAWNPTVNPPFSETQIASGAPWAGATKVRCADFDESEERDYAGLATDGHNVVLRRTNSGGTTTVLVDVVDQVVDMFVLQWLEGGAQELAVLTTDDLFVYSGSGTLIDTFTPPSPGAGIIAPVHFGTAGPDRVAWASLDSAGATTRFDLVRHATPQLEGPLTPQYDDIVAMAAADYDNDGDEDLVMTHRSDRLAWLYKSGFVDGNSRVFHPNRSQAVNVPELDPDAEVLPNGGTFVFRDLGNDHRPDLLLPVEVNGVTTFEVLSTVHRADATSVEIFAVSGQQFLFDTILNPLSASYKINTLDFDPQGSMTHLQVIVWNQENATTPLDATSDSDAQYFVIQSSQFSGEPDPFWQVQSVHIDLDELHTTCTMPVRWIEMRLVEMDGTEMIDAGPTYTCAVTTRYTDFCVIDTLGNSEMELVPSFDCGGVPCWPSLGSTAAQAIPRTRKPGPASGVVTAGIGNPSEALPIPPVP